MMRLSRNIKFRSIYLCMNNRLCTSPNDSPERKISFPERKNSTIKPEALLKWENFTIEPQALLEWKNSTLWGTTLEFEIPKHPESTKEKKIPLINYCATKKELLDTHEI